MLYIKKNLAIIESREQGAWGREGIMV